MWMSNNVKGPTGFEYLSGLYFKTDKAAALWFCNHFIFILFLLRHKGKNAD